jgi:ribosomal protein S18 acetylase RimI-like enzyme
VRGFLRLRPLLSDDLGVSHLRAADAADGPAVVAIFQAARAAALAYLPILHSDAEDRAFFGGLIADGAVTAAADSERVVGFIALSAARIEHLYVDPGAWRRGVGSLLLRHAQTVRPGGLDLWVFRRNRAAIAFYESHGFAIAQTTTGANEEREPDARMVWPAPDLDRAPSFGST